MKEYENRNTSLVTELKHDTRDEDKAHAGKGSLE